MVVVAVVITVADARRGSAQVTRVLDKSSWIPVDVKGGNVLKQCNVILNWEI